MPQFLPSDFDEMRWLVSRGDTEEALEVGRRLRREYVLVHDGLRDVVAWALDFAYRELGSAEGEALGTRVVRGLMGSGSLEQYALPSLQEKLQGIADGWHWHATSFSLRQTEDRVTFVLDPCGSGMRLAATGAFDGPSALARAEVGSPATFGLAGLPSYCNHCAEINMISLAAGDPSFVVEGWTEGRGRGLCYQHSFASIASVPDEFFVRAGLDRPREVATGNGEMEPLTDEQLRYIATDPVERIAEALEAGEIESALSLVERAQRGWGEAIHDVYRRWIASIFSEAVDQNGPEFALRMSEYALPRLFAHLASASPGTWDRSWRLRMRLTGVQSVKAGVSWTSSVESLFCPDRWPKESLPPEQAIRALMIGAAQQGLGLGQLATVDGQTLTHTIDFG
jgi:hypothetical protein